MENSFWHALVYGTIQGFSEFLPISSSAHLLLFSRAFSIPAPSASLEAAVHFGSFLALCTYFWRTIGRLFAGTIDLVRGREFSGNRQLVFNLILATLPVLLCGFILFMTCGRSQFQTFEIIAWTTVLFGFALLLADKMPTRRTLADMTKAEAFLGWGVFQCFAFIYGVSRSGICITWGRLASYQRKEAVTFSFLMALPSLLGAVYLLGKAWFAGAVDLTLSSSHVFLAVTTSFTVGLLTIHILMQKLAKGLLQSIALYRIALGLLLLFGTYVWGWH